MTSLTWWSPKNHLLPILRQAEHLICWSGQLWSGLRPGVISCFLHSDGQKGYFPEQIWEVLQREILFLIWVVNQGNLEAIRCALRTEDQILRRAFKGLYCSVFTCRTSRLPAPWHGPTGPRNFAFKLRCQILHACVVINGVTPCGSSFRDIIFLQDCVLLGGLCLFILKIDLKT